MQGATEPSATTTDDSHLRFSLCRPVANTRRGLLEDLRQTIHETDRANVYFGNVSNLGGNTIGQVRDRLGHEVSDGATYPCIGDVTPNAYWLKTLMPPDLAALLIREEDGTQTLPPNTYFLQGHADMFSHLKYKQEKGCSLYREELLKNMALVSGAPKMGKWVDTYKTMFVPFVMHPVVGETDTCFWTIEEIVPDVHDDYTDVETYTVHASEEWHKYKCICSHDNHSAGLAILEPRLYVPMENVLMRRIARLRHALATKDFTAATDVITEGGQALLDCDALDDFNDDDLLRDCRNSGGTITATHSFQALRRLEQGLWMHIWHTANERLIFCFGSTCKRDVTFTNKDAGDPGNTREPASQRRRFTYENLYQVVLAVRGATGQ